MSLSSNIAGTFEQMERLAGNALNSVKPDTWREAANKAQFASGEVAKSSILARILMSPFTLSRKLVEWPLNLVVVKPLKATIGTLATMFEKAPRTMVIGTGLVAVGGAANWIEKRHSKALQQQLEASAELAASRASGIPNYMNSVSPLESQALEAKLQDHTSIQNGHTAAVDAARAQAPKPEAAVASL